ncbi:MAG: serine O-acetyltransferase [Candidatus Eisenbacteria bacterium]|nr:serine O-acetyltransferase [Candidatus Eisenbacteria bacterium]
MGNILGDIRAVRERDPSAGNILTVILTHPGLHAVIAHRIASQLKRWGIPFIPHLISYASRGETGVYIHPSAQIGKRFFIDTGTGVVIGETAMVGDDVSVFQGVNLGGSGREKTKRHPTIGDRVVLAPGAKILGNITVGDDVYVAANSVVVKDVAPGNIAVGIPARLFKKEAKRFPLDHFHIPDPVSLQIDDMKKEIEKMRRVLETSGLKAQLSLLDDEQPSAVDEKRTE